jgi:hypothetical protein
VLGLNLWSAGKFTLNCYGSQNGAVVNKYFYVCDEEINDLLVAKVDPNSDSYAAIIACQDSAIRVITDTGKMTFEQNFGSPIITLNLSESVSQRNCPLIAYGLHNGNFGLFELNHEEAIVLWEID